MDKMIDIDFNNFCFLCSHMRNYICVSKEIIEDVNLQINDIVKINSGTSAFLKRRISKIHLIDKNNLELTEHPLWSEFLKTCLLSKNDILKLIKENKDAVSIQFKEYLEDVGYYEKDYILKLARI